jgi:hypothetical protein
MRDSSFRKKKVRKRRPPVSPLEIDSYGADARICAVADSAEMRVFASGQLRIGELEDQLRDNRITLEPQLSSMPGSGDEDDDEGIERVASMSANDSALVFDAFRERQQILRNLYPFDVTDSALVWRPRGRTKNYLALLGISWAHAVGLKRTPTVERTFERVVLAALAARRLKVDELRKGEGFAGTFPARLEGMAVRLGMTSNAQAAIYRCAANDEGADVVSVHDWGDKRQGRWWAVGQATCGRSEMWKSKLAEPEGHTWANWLSENHPPSTFLAVPHHVQQSVLYRLTQGGRGFVLDRLRLVLCHHTVSKAERELIAEMHDAGAWA